MGFAFNIYPLLFLFKYNLQAGRPGVARKKNKKFKKLRKKNRIFLPQIW